MKGLFLKDLYQVRKYCRSYLLIAAAFIAVSFASDENLFFVFYPCLLCGMIPVTLLSYDESSRWSTYSLTMPYTRQQLVSVKYLIGLILQSCMLVVTGLAQFARMHVHGSFDLKEYAVFMVILLTVSLVPPAICLPFIFRYGVEKGRMAYYVMIGLICAIGFAASRIFSVGTAAKIEFNAAFLLIMAAGIGIYVLSWYLSVCFYRKREIGG